MSYSVKELLKYAGINSEGGILLGQSIVVDGHDDTREYRIITHAHSDHLQGLNKSLQKAKYIISTPITYDIMKALGLIKRRYLEKYIQINYNEKIRLSDNEALILCKAEHIPGASQVLVETSDVRVGYTGDFKNPGKGTPILYDLDVLVIEATYGKPEWTRPFRDEVDSLFADLVKDLLVKGPVYVHGFHGKVQEAMMILRSHGIDAPFIATPAVYRVTKALEKHGYWFGKVYSTISLEAKDIAKSNWYVLFTHTNNYNSVKINNDIRGNTNINRIILTGWEFNEPYKRIRNNTWIVALSDHADFEQLLYYVDEARPKLLIVDNYRQGAGEVFAREVRRRLGIPAIPQPLRYVELPII